MKKLLSFLALGGALIMLASCHKEKEDDVIKSPEAAQEYLAETGMELARMIDADLKSQKSTMDLLAYLIAKYEDFDASPIGKFIEAVENGIRTETYTENGNTPYAPVRILESLQDYAMVGTRAGTMRTSMRIITYAVSMPKFYGAIKADDANGTFILDPSVRDRLEITLYDQNSKPVVMTLRGSDNTSRISIVSSVNENSFREGKQTEALTRKNEYFVDVPETITLDMVHEGKSLVSAKVKSSLALDVNSDFDSDETVEYKDGSVTYNYSEHYNTLTIDFTKLNIKGEISLPESNVAKLGASADADGVNLNTSLSKGNKSVLSLGAALHGNMTLIDDLLKNAGAVEDEAQAFGMLSLLGYKADANLDLLDRVNVKLDCANIGELLKAVAQVEGTLDAGLGEKEVKSALGKLNAQISTGLYLAGSKKKTAHLEIGCVKDEDEESGFALEPMLVFDEDGSSCSLEEFFSAECFEKVVAAFMDIIMPFLQLIG